MWRVQGFYWPYTLDSLRQIYQAETATADSVQFGLDCSTANIVNAYFNSTQKYTGKMTSKVGFRIGTISAGKENRTIDWSIVQGRIGVGLLVARCKSHRLLIQWFGHARVQARTCCPRVRVFVRLELSHSLLSREGYIRNKTCSVHDRAHDIETCVDMEFMLRMMMTSWQPLFFTQ
jgi:hypothetical protein